MTKKKRYQPELITDLRPVTRQPSTSKKLKKFLKQKSKILTIILAVVITAVAAIVVLGILHKSSPKQDLAGVESAVGKLMILPTGEQPTLATVEDKTKLRDKFLSSKAENGDRVLIYAKSHTVIIYRPSINKIAGVGAVTGDPALAEASGATLTVLDSTNNPSKTQSIISQVKALYPDIKVADGGKANRQDFPYTIVIDNTDQKTELRAALMKAVNGKQGFQPSSENAPTTDLTIIVGKD